MMKKEFKLYRIGGCVRDKLMGVKSKDIDYAFVFQNIDKSISPENYFLRMEQCLIEMGVKIHITKPDCFTIRGKFNNEDVDYVMARKETYPNPESRIPLVEMGDLYADQLRRDFSINAIAEDEGGNLIDPFNGIEDLKKMILKCPINAQTSLTDDPLRMIRALRFMVTKGFSVNKDIFYSFNDPAIWEKFERVVSRERVREELFKMFNHDTSKAFRILTNYVNSDFLNNFIFKDDLWLKPTLKPTT